MKKLVALCLCLAMTGVMFVGCSPKPAEQTTTQTQSENTQTEQGEEAVALKVALCVTGVVNDMGWCQAAYDGLLLVEEKFGAEVAYTENLGPADMVAAFTEYAASGYDVVIGHGFQFGDAALEVGELYPDTKFICVEAGAAAENVASYVMKCEETAFLNGMLAASMSESGKIGFIGPIQGASLVKIMNGFEDGAKFVNADIEVQTAWSGSFADTALAKEAAVAMIENGVDIMGHCANESGTGAINAAKEAGIYAIGDSYDQSVLAPEIIMTSAIYNVPQLIEAAISDIINGDFEGTIKEMGMADGIVELAPYHGFEDIIPEEVKALIAETAAKIVAGEFVVPCDTTTRN